MVKKKVRLNACGKLRRHRPYTSYGERIAALGTQREIAKAMGLSQQTVSKKLQGETSIALHDLVKVADYFDVPPAYFLDGSGDPEMSRVEERVREKPGPLRDLALLACSLSHGDQEKLLAVATTMLPEA